MQAVLNEKAFENPVEEKNIENEGGIFFNPTEWKYFKLEIEDMINSDREFSFQKAIHNARYLAKIDKATKEMDAGHWIEHDLIEVEDDDQ